jgi:uncharacterized protein YkwD
MRLLSWIGGLVIMLAIAVGAIASVTHQRSVGAPTLAAAKGPVALYVAASAAEDGAVARPVRPSPSPAPAAVEAAPANPAPPAAQPAPARAPAPRPPAPPPVAVGSTQQALINQDRAANGLGPLTWNNCLLNVAASNAQRIAAQRYLSHTNGAQADLACGLGHQAGENVGKWCPGINDGQINALFMNSAGHRANILGPYHYVATNWVAGGDGCGYIGVEFG